MYVSGANSTAVCVERSLRNFFIGTKNKIKFSCQNPDTDTDAHKSEMTAFSCIDIKNWQ